MSYPVRWVLIVAVVAAVVGFVVAILTSGGRLVVAPTHPPSPRPSPPVTLDVVPVSIGWPPLASSSACALAQQPGVIQGHVAENESPVQVRITVTSGTRVTGVGIEVDGEPYPPSVYRACASTLPRYAGTPKGWQIVRLPQQLEEAQGYYPRTLVPIPGLQPGKTFNLIVQPPLGQSFAGKEYTWRIDVAYTGGGGTGTDFSDLFTTLALPP